MINCKNIITKCIIIVGSIYLLGWGGNVTFAKNIIDKQTGNIIHSIKSTNIDLTLGELTLNSKINVSNLLACNLVTLKKHKFNYVCLTSVKLPKYINDSLYTDITQHKNTALILYAGHSISTLKAKWIYIKLRKKFLTNVLSKLQKTFGQENLSYPLKSSNFVLTGKYSTTYLWRTKNTISHESKELELDTISNPYNRLPNYKSSMLTLRYSSYENPFLKLVIEYLKFNIQRGYIPEELENSTG